MSTVYGGPAAYGPPRRVNFGWISEAFALFGQNAGIWIVGVLATIVLPGVIGAIIGGTYGATTAMSGAAQQPHPFGAVPGSPSYFSGHSFSNQLPLSVNIAIWIISMAWAAFMYGGLYRTAVMQVRGETIGFGDLFSGGPYFWRILGFNIISGLAIGIGFVLCIVPGLIVAAMLLPGYALIADGESLSGALSRASDGMKADLWNGVLFILVLGLLILVSEIPCGLGLFVTLPMLWLISALAYRDMIGMPGGGAPAYGGYQAQQPGVWPPPPAQTPPPAWGQNPTPQPGAPQPPPQWGQTPGGTPPPRRTLGGEPLDTPSQDPPPGSA